MATRKLHYFEACNKSKRAMSGYVGTTNLQEFLADQNRCERCFNSGMVKLHIRNSNKTQK